MGEGISGGVAQCRVSHAERADPTAWDLVVSISVRYENLNFSRNLDLYLILKGKDV